MKKKLLAILLAVFCLGLGAAGAAQLIINNANTQDKILDLTQFPAVYHTSENPAVLSTTLSNASDNAVFEKINTSGLSEGEVYDSIFAYKRFLKYYNPDEQAIAYIQSLIGEGADVRTLIDLYDFWTTTAEDITVIGDMYALSGLYTDAYWKEDAFDAVTKKRHGVLDVEGVKEYLSRGASREDIATASILCRRGVYTVTEILDKLLEGKSWESLIYEHVSRSDSSNGEDNTQLLALESSSLSNNPSNLLNCLRYSELTSQDFFTCLEEIDGQDALLQRLNDYNSEISEEVERELEQDGIIRPLILIDEGEVE